MTLFCFAVFGAGNLAQAASLYDYPNVAVLPYANRAAVSSELSLADASLVSEFVIEKLLDSSRFNVVERDVMMEIMQEHSFSMSGMVDPSTAPKIGKLLGVNFFVVGSVTGLSTKVSGVGYNSEAAGAGFNKNTVIAKVKTVTTAIKPFPNDIYRTILKNKHIPQR